MTKSYEVLPSDSLTTRLRYIVLFCFFQAEDGIRDWTVTGVQTCALPILVHLTPQERAARGKAARAEVPRSSHAGWDAPSPRPDPVGLLQEQAKNRVQELVPIRRSEERRGGEEGRSRWSPCHSKKKQA